MFIQVSITHFFYFVFWDEKETSIATLESPGPLLTSSWNRRLPSESALDLAGRPHIRFIQ